MVVESLDFLHKVYLCFLMVFFSMKLFVVVKNDLP